MMPIVRRSTATVIFVLAALVTGSLPAAGHAPDPIFGDPDWAQDQVIRYRWMAGEVPPLGMQTPIKAGVADSNATKASRAPSIVYDAAGTSTVEYGVNVFCGVNGLACFSRNAPHSFRIAFREHGHRYDWGQLRWCQMMSTIANGCYDVENIMLDEVGHVLGLGHHANFSDDSDYGDAVVQTYARARPKAFWDVHEYGRCDVATLQILFDMTGWSEPYSTCLDLATDLVLASSASSIQAGTTITFSATLKVGANDGDGRLGGNPLANRTVHLQRRSPGSSTWTTLGVMTPGSTAGTYTLRQSPTATYEWRAVFLKPANEGLRGRTSAAVPVTVSGCSTSGCPQSAPAPSVSGASAGQ